MKTVLWVLRQSLEQGPEGPTSKVASIRYRAILPAAGLVRHGWDSRFAVVESTHDGNASPLDLRADALVLNKSFNPFNEIVVRRAMQAGTRVLFDISDNHFDSPRFAAHYRALAMQCDAITVPTASMAQVVMEHTGRDAIVIADPVERSRMPPGALPDGRAPLRVLWYGHATNLAALVKHSEDLAAAGQRAALQLKLLCSEGPRTDAACEMLRLHGIDTTFIPWSPSAMDEALAWCHLVIIPADVNDTRGKVKSANRLVEALWAGRYVVAHPLEAYREFSDCASICERLSEGIDWALRNPADVASRIVRAQEAIAERFSVEAVARHWDAALQGAAP